MTDTHLDSKADAESHSNGPCDAAQRSTQDYGLIDSVTNLVDQLQTNENQYSQVIENQNVLNDKIDESQTSINSLINLVEALTNVVKTSVEQFNVSRCHVELPSANLSESNNDQDNNPDADAPPELHDEMPAPSGWEAQKAELLKGFSESGDAPEIPVATPPADATSFEEAENTDSNHPLDDSEKWLDPSGPEIDSPIESKEIVELRKKLEEKLRRAEIEISIERAKISRVQQELDQQQTDLRRQVSKHQKNVDGAKETVKKGRWSRFLGRGGKK